MGDISGLKALTIKIFRMMKKTIQYALILDKSGSMQNLRQEVISSFNKQVSMIQKLGKNQQEAEIKVTLCTFNESIDFKYLFQSIDKLKKLNPDDYRPDSYTALFDAIGITMNKMNEIKSPDYKIFLAVFTDGLENASSDFTAKDIRKKIKRA